MSARSIFHPTIRPSLLLVAIETELRLFGSPINFDLEQRTGALFREEWIDGFEHPTLPTRHGLGNPGLEFESAVEIEDVAIQVIAAGKIDTGAHYCKRDVFKCHDLVDQSERAGHCRNDFIDCHVLRLSLASAAEHVDLVLNLGLEEFCI